MADEKDTPAAAEKAKPEWKGSMSASKPLTGPDGHVHLSDEDIKTREAEGA